MLGSPVNLSKHLHTASETNANTVPFSLTVRKLRLWEESLLIKQL